MAILSSRKLLPDFMLILGFSMALLSSPSQGAEPGLDNIDNAIRQLSFKRGLASQLARLRADLRKVFSLDTYSLNILHEASSNPLAPVRLFETATLDSVKDSDTQAWLLQRLADYHQQFPVPEANCSLSTLPLPVSLAAASEQITDLAREVTEKFQDAIPDSSWQQLAESGAAVAEQLQRQPYTLGEGRERRKLLEEYFQALSAADLPAIICATRHWSQLSTTAWREHIRQLMQTHSSADGELLLQENTAYGQIIFAGRADNSRLANDILFLADLGGNDFYGFGERTNRPGAPQLIIDYAGDDRYEAAGINAYASGYGSSSLLLDLAGNDRYLATSLSQGSGILGVGALLDLQGDDYYQASNFAQGFATYGLGLFLDSDGNDDYDLGALGQGLGMPGGMALLEDLSGDDRFKAMGLIATNYGTPGLFDAWAQGVGLGIRNLAPGGSGTLIDRGGNNQFDAGSFAQGGGYFYGLGQLLVTGPGDDRYFGSRYNFAWGAHGGLGHFMDRAGNDQYSSRQIVAGGLAWDHSIALFLDSSGNDDYQLGDFSYGAAAHGSLAVFVDADGSDFYRGAIPADAVEGTPNLGLFIDLGLQESELAPALRRATACELLNGISLILPAAPNDEIFAQYCRP